MMKSGALDIDMIGNISGTRKRLICINGIEALAPEGVVFSVLFMPYPLTPRLLFAAEKSAAFYFTDRLPTVIKKGTGFMLNKIQSYMTRPALYARSTSKFWDDEHISKGMLESHLEPTQHGATDNHAFVRQSVQWIATAAPVLKYRSLLDLGCGPGIYAELFDEAGYRVTGLDLSERSVSYARESAQAHNRQITYHLRDYLTLDYIEQFDIVTLINCDFGVLATEDRANLLRRIFTALKPGGRLIFDVFTPVQYSGMEEYRRWEFAPEGFWSAEQHLCLNSLYRYDAQNTFLRQYLVVTEQEVNCYNIWDHTFTKSELLRDLSDAGFIVKDLYGDIAGNEYSAGGKTICVIAEKTA